MDLPPQASTMTPSTHPVNSTPPTPPPPPRGFPFAAILIFIVVAALLIGGFFVVRQILKATQKPQTVTLTYWGLWESESIIKPLIEEYQSAHPDVKINYIFQSPREYRERLQNALSQSKGPDIFRIHNTWVPMFKTDLSPIPSDVYSASAFESAFYPVAKSDLRLGPNYVAVPLEIDGLAMYVNDSLFSDAGLTPPTSWEELRRTAIDLSVCDSENGTCSSGDKILVSGVALGTADNVDHWPDILATLMLQNNVNLNSPAGRPAEEALQFYTIFNRSDHLWDSTLPNSTQAFAGGKLAIYFAPSWRVFDIQSLNRQLKFSVHPLPQLPLDPARGEKPITWATYWAEAVNAKSPYQKQSWDFLKFLTSSSSLQKLYQTASLTRAFGEPYPRGDMADQLKTAPYVGAYVSQAPSARSWYLASDTYDGPTGINSLLSKYFADSINSVNQGRSATEAVQTLNTGVNQVLSRYGLAPSLPAANP